MTQVGVVAQFEFNEGNEAAIADFFDHGRSIVEGQPAGTLWFAFRRGPTTYGAFAVFADAEDREALLSSGGPALSRSNAQLFASPPTFERVDVIAARLPR
jgi:hypothetical protein